MCITISQVQTLFLGLKANLVDIKSLHLISYSVLLVGWRLIFHCRRISGIPILQPDDWISCTSVSGSSIDSYIVGSTNDVTALIGSQSFAGAWDIAFQNYETCFESASETQADIIYLPYNNGEGVIDWSTISTQTITVSDNAATVSIEVAHGDDAYAVHLYTSWMQK